VLSIVPIRNLNTVPVLDESLLIVWSQMTVRSSYEVHVKILWHGVCYPLGGVRCGFEGRGRFCLVVNPRWQRASGLFN
jgi:hypothetical protein